MYKFMTLSSLCSWADWFESYLVENPEDRFSHDVAQVNKGIAAWQQQQIKIKFCKWWLICLHNRTYYQSVCPAH